MDKILARIDSKREEIGMTQTELLKKIGISQSNYGAWKRGTTKTYRLYLPEIAEILGTTINYLTKGEESEFDPFLRLWQNTPEEVQKAVLTILENCQQPRTTGKNNIVKGE